jgi:hypothetical protein
MFTKSYLREFTGGIAFEYSTEMVHATADWPYKKFGEGNFGVVYFSPEDCDDVSTPCEVVRYPQFKTLADAFAKIQNITPPESDDRPKFPACPDNYPPLDEFEWASDDVDSLECPPEEDVAPFLCNAESGCPARTAGDLYTSMPTSSPAPTYSEGVILLAPTDDATSTTDGQPAEDTEGDGDVDVDINGSDPNLIDKLDNKTNTATDGDSGATNTKVGGGSSAWAYTVIMALTVPVLALYGIQL